MFVPDTGIIIYLFSFIGLPFKPTIPLGNPNIFLFVKLYNVITELNSLLISD